MKRAILIFLVPTVSVLAGGDLREQFEMADGYPYSRIEILRRLIDTRPADAAVLRDSLVRLWLEVGDVGMAAAELETWPDAAEDLRTIVAAKELAATPEKIDEATGLLRDYLSRHPDSEDVLRVLIDELQAAGKREEITEVLVASPVTPGAPDLLLLRARQLRDGGRYEEALRDAALAADQFGDDESVQAALPAFERLKDALPRLAALQSALDADPSELPSLVMDAGLSASAGLEERARRSARRAREAWPDSAAALLVAAGVGVVGRDEAGAAGVFVDSLPRDPMVIVPLDQKIAEGGQGVRTARAEALLGLGQPGLALRDAEAVLEKSPSDPGAFRAAIAAECAMGRPEAATARLEEYVAGKPSRADLAAARRRIAEAWFAAGRLQEALDVINLSIEARPDPAGYRLRAAIYERLGRSAEAAEDIRRSEKSP